MSNFAHLRTPRRGAIGARQTRDLPAIADQHDFLLLALDAVENGTEIPGDFGDAQGFHGRTISNRI